MVDYISNCIITDSDAKVLKQCVLDKQDPLYKKYGGFHTGVDLIATTVFSLTPGKIIHVGSDGSHKKIIVALDDFNWCIYGNLRLTSVSIGDTVFPKSYVGYADRYVHFEYCNSTQSLWPVHVLKWTLYKQDPMVIIETPQKFGALSSFKVKVDSFWENHFDTDVDMPMIRMLRFNRGDDEE